MASAPKLYKKLVGSRGGVVTRTSLWIASDHVLYVEGSLFSERYQRVYLRDVQGFFIRPSSQWKWVSGIGGGLTVLFGGLLALKTNIVEVLFVFLCLSALVLLFGLFLARTCHFHFVTAVQRGEWANVARYRSARRLVARISPLIGEAQASSSEGVSVPV